MLPDVLPNGLPPFGALHQRRAGLRKRWAMVVGQGQAGYTLLTHNSKPLEVPPTELPPHVEPEIAGFPFTPRSPIGRMLRYAVASGAGALDLGWPADLLLEHAFAVISNLLWAGRPAAVDLLALDRPDLLPRCGLPHTEIVWLNLVYAARRHDIAGLVDAAATLPADRYRHKIAILAGFVGELGAVAGSAARLASGLRYFADSEPLAVVLEHRLGLVACSPQQHLDDAALLAASFGAPEPIKQLTGMVSARHAGPPALALLGARGRLAVAHGNPALTPALPGTFDVDGAPLAVLDDLVDADVVGADLIAGSGRSASDKSYLVGRIAPQLLSDEQVAELGHIPERARRAFLAGERELTKEEKATPIGRHVATLDLLLRNRSQDVADDDILPAHRDVAELLITALKAAQAGEKPAGVIDPAILADKTTWQPLVSIFGTDRLRDGGQELAQRSSEFFEWLALVAAREHLFLADWPGGATAARQCLDFATAEPLLDEAQNLLACALHNLGEDQGALAALQAAIEGEYSVALLANIGVVAAQLDPRLAAEHLARIVREAPTAAMRANAARSALEMWRSDAVNVWHGEGDQATTLPTVLREPLRSVVGDSIGLGDFRLIMSAMAKFDASWLRAPHNLDRSPHRTTLEARFYQAMAAEDMFLSAVDVLASITDWNTAPQWLVDERDVLIHNTLDFLLEHVNDPDNTAGVIAQALATKVRGLPPQTRAQLALLGVATLTYHLSTTGSEIGDTLIGTFQDTERTIATLPEEDRKSLADLVELTIRRITLNLLDARRRDHNGLVEPYNEAVRVLTVVQRGVPVWFEARHLVAQVAQICRDTRDQLKPWVRKLDDAGTRDDVMDFLELSQETELKAERVLNS